MNDSISQEVLLAGVALNHTFHGLTAGAEYTISVTAATDAGLGQQAVITATTVATTPQSLEAVISAPGMYGPCLHNITLLYCVCLALIVLHTVCNHTILYHHFYIAAGSVFGILTVAVLALALALGTRWVFQVSKVNAHINSTHIRMNACIQCKLHIYTYIHTYIHAYVHLTMDANSLVLIGFLPQCSVVSAAGIVSRRRQLSVGRQRQ